MVSVKIFKRKKIAGPPSWSLRSKTVQLEVTQIGGHMAPVTFRCGKKLVQPFYISPFWNRNVKETILKVLRGDFFCLPFGDNAKLFRGKKYPTHGESSNGRWKFASKQSLGSSHTLTLRLPLRMSAGQITKHVTLCDDESVVYQEHIISGMNGLNCPGHHPTLEFRSKGYIAVSPFLQGSTYPHFIETPEQQSYCGLKPGVKFRSLGKVPLVYGGESDLSIYPARKGHMDVIQIVADPKLPVAWNTVTFPEEGWLYFALRDPKILRQTVLWFSNGGTYASPWNGQTVNVLGIEDVTAYFSEGISNSINPNPWNKRGIPTALKFNPKTPTSIRYIMGVTPVPRGFKRVKDIKFEENKIVFLGDRGRASAKVNWKFVTTGK